MEFNNTSIPFIAGTGDTIVGSFSDTGASSNKGGAGIAGTSDEVRRMQQKIMEHALRTGATMLPPVTTTGKPAKQKKTKAAKTTTTPTPVTFPLANVGSAGLVEDLLPLDTPTVVPLTQSKPTAPVRKYKVQFSNNFGEIKMQVEDVLECPLAYALIFSSEEDIIFSPKANETLKFKDHNGKEGNAYFPGAVFTLPDFTKKLMILFKVPTDESDE